MASINDRGLASYALDSSSQRIKQLNDIDNVEHQLLFHNNEVLH